jgi:hypothetical protein
MTITGAFTAAMLVAGVAMGCSPMVQGDAPLRGSGLVSASEDQLQLIVQFREEANPADPQYLANLSLKVGITLAYVRPMSGGGHVLRAVIPAGTAAEVLQRLKRRPEIVDVLVDQPARRQ